MTSPLSSLKKARRTPLRPIPFRNVVDIDAIIKSDMDQNSSLLTDDIPEDCLELTDDVTTSILQQKRSNNVSKPQITREKNGPSDMDLMSSMMGRISQLQLRVQFHEKELSEKNNQIKALQQKLKSLEKTQSHGSEQKLQALETENKKLRKQMYEMEEFLADYGMIWAGNSDSDSDLIEDTTPVSMMASKQLWEPKDSIPHFKCNYDAVIENIRDLNILAGEGETKIHHTAGGAELKRPDPVNLSLYENGIIMFNGPFRPFSDIETQQCIQDLQDGYFPTELQKRYPDGVLFSVHDHRHLRYEEKVVKAFEGQGQMLGGETKPSRLVPTNLNKKGTSATHVKTVSSDAFLGKLPSNVIKRGKVIDIRQAVSDMIQGQEQLPESISVVNTSVVDDLRRSAKGGRDVGLEAVGLEESCCSTLRIKHADTTFVLVMKYSETVGDIRKHLSEHSKSLQTANYDLVTSYPRTVYSDDHVTLEEAGLVPNALLHLQIRK